MVVELERKARARAVLNALNATSSRENWNLSALEGKAAPLSSPRPVSKIESTVKAANQNSPSVFRAKLKIEISLQKGGSAIEARMVNDFGFLLTVLSI